MKALLFFIVVAVTFACSCTEIFSKQDTLKDAIPGSYVRSSSHEYGIEHDTLVITLQNESADEYKILRKWKYQRVLDGKQMEPTYEQQVTTAIFNADRKLLEESDLGNHYSFDVEKKLLFKGSTKYVKL